MSRWASNNNTCITQAAVLVTSQIAGFMTIKTHNNVVERWFSMTARDLIDLLAGKRLSVYIANLTAKPTHWPNFMIVAFASNAPTGITQSRDDDPHMLKDRGPVLTPHDKFNSDLTVNGDRYEPPERSSEKVDRHSTIKESVNISKTYWSEDLSLSDQHSTNRNKFMNMYT